MAETSPFQPVRDSCRSLRQEWERMMHNAESATNQLLSSFKAQRESLEAERAEVQLLDEEVVLLRRSVFQHRHEEEKKVLNEMVAAERISKNICIQLAEAKQLQCQLTDQLGDLRSRIAEIRNPKLEEHESKAVSWDIAASQLSNVTHHLAKECFVQEREVSCATEENNFGVAHTSSDVLPDQHISDAVNKEGDSSFGSRSHNAVSLTTPLQCVDNSSGKMRFDVITNQGDYQLNNHQQNSDLKLEGVSSCLAIPNYVFSGYKGTHKLESESTKVSSFGIVKEEPCEEEIPFLDKQIYEESILGNVSSEIKREAFKDEIDELDHVLLSKRLELVKKRRFCNEQIENDETIKGSAFCHVDSLKKMSRDNFEQGNLGPRKHFKKYRVPIEIALQEDAPGLLEKLQEKGLLEDMELYGGFYDDDYTGDCTQYDPFKDLESVASKLWGTPTGYFKQPHIIRQHLTALNKGSTYCLSCLVSLIEQTRSLKQRCWPVEWGWCRQLQAFLFVFDKHNRIVMERPEYGNATYFFELVESLPVKWQVERLIRVLSVAALGKTALLENRPLQLGHELTVDEAKILEDYGWNENTGLGSFLNFCDRVVHDIKDDDNAEWRKKIGHCLMDGHDRGRITVQNIPETLQKILQYHGKRFNDGGDDEVVKPFSQTRLPKLY